MSTWKLDECRAIGLLKLEDESEVLTSGNEPSGREEMTDAYEELEEMKQRLILLRHKILGSQPEKCQDMGDHKDSTGRTRESLQLEELRRQKCVLKCRLKEATEHLEDTSREIEELENWRCLLQSRILQMKRKLAQFEEFKPRVIHQFGLCIERWEQQRIIKIDCATYREKVHAQIVHADNSRKCVVPMNCHKHNRQYIRVQLLLLRVFLHNLLDAMVSDFQYFCREMSITFTRGIVDNPSPKIAETPTNSIASLDVEERE
ncbi:uncharacterized protein LOC108050924 [Drosophila rhopaloa]|uniref:Uncharacterized protein LOC108050924 n=1 Tax=Drosophila rhopaloa TaxID=1041015 RepID=A0A6P4FE92_DRORH|nr:uncharacterized protein LOC108050924 [Drosophila rhopaloa]